MAAEEQGVSPFPHPPSLFYKLYTDDNVKAKLVPPPPLPIQGSYSMFGGKFDTEDAMVRPLQEQGIKQLYPDKHDRKAELKKLNRSIVVCFLELLDILINDPASPARNQKISDLSYLFINMHHLINEFRPHQARETLKVILERQKKQREEMIVQVQRDTEEARAILKECSESLSKASSTVPHSLRLTQPTSSTTSVVVVGEGEDDVVMDTSSGSTAAGDSNKLQDGPTSTSSESVQNFVQLQDAELCSFIDSLLAT